MRQTYLRHWSLFTTLLIYCVVTSISIFLVLQRNHGIWVYPLDDTYIHMAIAKHAVQNGVWGVIRYEFSSATSSPVWTALIAVGFWLSGIHEIIPLLMTVGCSIFVIVVAYHVLRRYVKNQWFIVIALFVCMFGITLTLQTITGMEHILHLLGVLIFVDLVIEVLRSTANTYHYGAILLLAALLPIIRFESLFLLAWSGFILLMQKRWRFVALLSVCAAIPITVYGLWSQAHGWHFLPNSVLLKGNFADRSVLGFITSLGQPIVNSLANDIRLEQSSLAMLFILTVVAWTYARKSVRDERLTLITIFLLTLLSHLQFASVGWLFRYEAYFVGLGIILIACIGYELWQAKKIRNSILAVLMIIPFLWRGFFALTMPTHATRNIYQQHYTMAHFVQRYYPDARIAINDIGAVGFYSDAFIMDLFGLSTLDTANERINNDYYTDDIERIATHKQIQIALVNPYWFQPQGGLPPTWTVVGTWHMLNYPLIGNRELVFYAVQPQAAAELRQHLAEFAPNLPPDVVQELP